MCARSRRAELAASNGDGKEREEEKESREDVCDALLRRASCAVDTLLMATRCYLNNNIIVGQRKYCVSK